jgi:hypothetical protein
METTRAKHSSLACDMESDDQTSLSVYAGIPPALYKRPFEFPTGVGSFDQVLQDLNREMDRLKVQLATPAEACLTKHYLSPKKIEKHTGGRAGLHYRGNEEVQSSCSLMAKRAFEAIKPPSAHVHVRTVRTSSRFDQSRAHDHWNLCKSHKTKETVRRQFRDVSLKARRMDFARKFTAQRVRDRRRRLKVKTCAVAAGQNATVRTALHKLQHYHLDMKNLPFMPSNPSGPSFNVKANVQQVIGKLKTHHPDLCAFQPAHLTTGPAHCSQELEELEREYARVYRKYEHVKLEIIAVKSKTHLRYLMEKKALIKDRLRDLLHRMTSSSAKCHDHKEALCGRFMEERLNSQQNLLRDLRDVQNLFEKCTV